LKKGTIGKMQRRTDMINNLPPTSRSERGTGRLDKTTIICVGLTLFAALVLTTMLPKVTRGGEAARNVACGAAVMSPVCMLVLGLHSRRRVFVLGGLSQTPRQRLAGYIIYGGPPPPSD